MTEKEFLSRRGIVLGMSTPALYHQALEDYAQQEKQPTITDEEMSEQFNDMWEKKYGIWFGENLTSIHCKAWATKLCKWARDKYENK